MAEGWTGERSGAARPALVEDDQVVRREDRAEHFDEVAGEAVGGLSRAAREGYECDASVADRRPVAPQGERDRPGHRPSRVERHLELAAGEVRRFTAWPPGDLARGSGRAARAPDRRRARPAARPQRMTTPDAQRESKADRPATRPRSVGALAACASRARVPERGSRAHDRVCARGAPGGRSLQPRGRLRGPAVLLGADPARPRQRRARRGDAGAAGPPLPGEPEPGLRGRRHIARAGACGSPST